MTHDEIADKQLACYIDRGDLPEAADRASWGIPDIAVPAWAAAVPLPDGALFRPEYRGVNRRNRLIVPAVMLALMLMLGLIFVVGFVLVFALLITLMLGVAFGVTIMFGCGLGYGFGFMRGYDVGAN